MAIFDVIFPVFAIVMLGYLAARWQILSVSEVTGLSRFVFLIAFPVLLFNSFAKMDLPDRVDWGFMLSYYLAAVSIYFLAMFIQRTGFSGALADQAIFGLGSAFSNLVLVGLPIISGAFGDETILPLFMIVSVQSPIFFTLSSILIERSRQNGQSSSAEIVKRTVKSLATNPIVLSLFFGLAFNLAKIPIPGPISSTLDIFSRAALPCALFMLGASLNEFKVFGEFTQAGAIVGLKMILQPLLVWVLAFVVFNVDPLWGIVAVLASGMPVGVNTYLFAQSYQAQTKTVSTAILLSSLFAIFSKSVMLSIFLNQ